MNSVECTFYLITADFHKKSTKYTKLAKNIIHKTEINLSISLIKFIQPLPVLPMKHVSIKKNSAATCAVNLMLIFK